MEYRIALLFPSSRKGEYREGVWWYCGENNKRAKIKYTRSIDKATIFPSEERAKELICIFEKKYIPSNCPRFWVDKKMKIEIIEKN